MINVLKPQKLQKGDTIGIVATSFPLPAEGFPEYIGEYENGIKVLENLGFRVKEGKNLRKIKGWYAGTPEERTEDINAMFADQK